MVLDDLIGVLGMPTRLATPAQAVVAFTGIEDRERLDLQTELKGFNRTGERIGFLPDAPIELQPADLVLATVYENGRLHVVPGAAVPGGPPIAPGSVPLQLGSAQPAIYLAIRSPDHNLGGLGLFLDASPPEGPLGLALRRSPWQLLDHEGRTTETGVLHTHRGRGGVQLLEFVENGSTAAPRFEDNDVHRALPLGSGYYGGQVWVLPPIPKDRRMGGTPPAALAEAVTKLLPPEKPDALNTPHTWIKIPLPAGTEDVASALHRIAINTVTASNIEVFSEQISFARTGSVVTLRPEGRRDRHLMGVVSVTGESGGRYVRESAVDADLDGGRYRARADRLEFRPARSATGRLDGYAMVRLLYCDAENANGLEAGDLRRISSSLENVTAQITNLTPSRGGAAPPAYTDARLRFAEQLRTRERIVTSADVEITARAFDPRIRSVNVKAAPEVTHQGVQLVETVRVRVRSQDFADPEADLVALGDRLQSHLQSRATLGRSLRVEVERVA